MTPSTQALCARLAAGDESAFRPLVEALIPLAKSVARRSRQPRLTYDDMVQIASEAIVAHVRRAVVCSRPVQWLGVVARRAIIRAAVEASRAQGASLDAPRGEEGSWHDVTPDTRHVDPTDAIALRDALSTLSPADASTLSAHLVGDGDCRSIHGHVTFSPLARRAAKAIKGKARK